MMLKHLTGALWGKVTKVGYVLRIVPHTSLVECYVLTHGWVKMPHTAGQMFSELKG
jgi:hypothetical protein